MNTDVGGNDSHIRSQGVLARRCSNGITQIPLRWHQLHRYWTRRACGEGEETGGEAGRQGACDEGQDAKLAEKERLALKMAAFLPAIESQTFFESC